MQKARCLLVFLVLFSLLAAAGAGANGNGGANLWSLSLDDPDQCAAPGGTITYHGALANLAGVDLFGSAVLSILKIDPPYLAPVATFGFHADFLAALGDPGKLPAAGYTGALFYVSWKNDAPAGYDASGWFDGLFRLPSGDLIEDHSLPYIARVCRSGNPVPEPSSLLALASGLPMAGFLLRRRRS